MTHAFITGTTNSGTGMLRGLLAKHPKISTLWKEGHHYSRVLPRDRGDHTKRLFALRPQKFRWGEEEVERRDVKKLRKSFYKRWDTSKPVLMEKSPHHMGRMPFMAKVFEPAKFIILVRSGYAVTEGIHRRKGHDVKTCAKQWAEANRWALTDSPLVEHQWVSYENLVSSPQAVLARLFRFLDLDPVEVDMNAEIPRKNLMGRKFSLADSPDFNAESMKRLSKKDIATIEAVAGDMLKHFGYLK